MAIVYNHDVAGLHQRMNRFITEMIKSASNGVSMFNEFDQARLMQYVSAMRFYHAWVTDQPQLDLPETTPREIELKKDPEVPDIENESIKDVVRMLVIARDELIGSQSARHSSGIIPFDSKRLLAVVDKVEAFMENYVANATPLDLPESSPQTELTGPGRGGV